MTFKCKDCGYPIDGPVACFYCLQHYCPACTSEHAKRCEAKKAALEMEDRKTRLRFLKPL